MLCSTERCRTVNLVDNTRRKFVHRLRLSLLTKGPRMQRVSIARRLGRRLMILVAAVVIAVYCLQSSFASRNAITHLDKAE